MCDCCSGGCFSIMFIIEAFVLSASEIVVSVHCSDIVTSYVVGIANFLLVCLPSIKMALETVVPTFQNAKLTGYESFGVLGLKYTASVLCKCYLTIHSLVYSTQCKGHRLDFVCLNPLTVIYKWSVRSFDKSHILFLFDR